MLTHVLTIARNTFVESVRQPIYLILIALCGIAILFTTWSAAYSMGFSDTAEVSGDNKMLLDLGLATVFVVGMLLAAFLATAVISKEIERKTVLTVVSKPVSRTSVVIGKYLGVAVAIAIAGVIMLLFLQMGLRHQVMSTAADKVDWPVASFTMGAVFLAVGVGIWCNYFYGWVFTQTCTMLLLPLMILAWFGVLLINKEWHTQNLLVDFKPQVFVASLCIIFSHMVLSSIAVAASARLGQVMTIVVCIGVFLGGLLSNHFLGTRAVNNDFVARIASATPSLPSMQGLANPGDTYEVTLELEPRVGIKPGSPFYYGPNPGGYDMTVHRYDPAIFDKGVIDVSSPSQLSDRSRPPALVILSQQGKKVTVQRIGADAPADQVFARPPRMLDYVFLQPTKYSPVALGAWAIIPNIQFFWLSDAVTQNSPMPLGHLGLIILYTIVQVGVFLSLAVALFQTREVG